MKKYYLIAMSRSEKTTAGTTASDPITVKIVDNPKGYILLREIEAPNYAEALKMVTFEKHQNGESKYL